MVGRVTFASGEQQEFTDSKALLQAIREELPFRSTTGFRFETLTDDPEVKKAVDDKPETAKRRNGSVPLLRIFLAACLSAEIFCPLLLIGWPGCLLSTVRALLRQFRRLKQIVAMVTCANQSNHLIPIYYSRQSEN